MNGRRVKRIEALEQSHGQTEPTIIRLHYTIVDPGEPGEPNRYTELPVQIIEIPAQK